jgi:hypothetical protein
LVQNLCKWQTWEEIFLSILAFKAIVKVQKLVTYTKVILENWVVLGAASGEVGKGDYN